MTGFWHGRRGGRATRNVSDITFSEIEELVKAEGDSALLDGLDRFLGAVILLAPAATGTPAAWALFGPKNELVKVGKGLIAKLSGKRKEDFVDKHRRMAAAHALLCYTAFFEAASKATATTQKRLKLDPSEKAILVKQAIASLHGQQGEREEGFETTLVPVGGEAVAVPHPAVEFDEKKRQLRELYELLATGFRRFIYGLAEWEAASEEIQARLERQLVELPESSLKSYEAQYFTLATRQPDFLIWANLDEHAKTGRQIAKLDAHVQQQIELTVGAQNKIDLGMAKLEDAVRTIPALIIAENAVRVTENLGRRYRAGIEARVIDDRYEGRDAHASLIYPRKCDIFVPQAFKVLRYEGPTSATARLEDESVWAATPTRDALGPFVLSYLSSPYSVDTPLIVLGHPGSGKSLLTEILAARLATPSYNPIRVELRDIDAEAEIQAQLQDQIRRDTGHEVRWAELSEQLTAAPPLVILDGFDELLQASGKVHAHYLDKVHEFQTREAELDRPVRVLVTSRITLIDKAKLPRGSTVIRLEEFDSSRRNRWVSVWNSQNAEYFRSKRVKPFEVPENEKIAELARQPLLLLMLALFDSGGNQLREHRDLDQTLLYNSLLRRFIERERNKGGEGAEFRALSQSEQDHEVDTDMRRLGVAAMSMFNRRTLHIHKDELDRDIAHFKLERQFKDASGRPLSQAELLLGSFFFVHESRSRLHAGSDVPEQDGQGAAAFEFLHNTFGEFLAADFILSHVFAETSAVAKMRADSDLTAELEQKLREPDKLREAWFTALAFTPFYTRPVILRMIREWGRHLLERRALDHQEFLRSLDAIVSNQVRQLLLGSTPPSAVMTGGRRTPYGATPLLGHYAVYSLNLVLLIAMLSVDSYVFDETSIPSEHEGGARPWDQLTHLWRSWLSIDDLSALAAVVEATRDGELVTIRPRRHFAVRTSGDGRLQTIRSAACAIGDTMLGALAGLHGFDAEPYDHVTIAEVERQLLDEHIELDLETTLRFAADYGWPATLRDRSDQLRRHISEALEPAGITRSHRALLQAVAHPDAPVALREMARTFVRPPDPSFPVDLPRGYAGDFVHVCAMLEPRWADYVVRGMEHFVPGLIREGDGSVAAELIRLAFGHADLGVAAAEILGSISGDGVDDFLLGVAILELALHRGDEVLCRKVMDHLLEVYRADILVDAPPDAVRSLIRVAGELDPRVEVGVWAERTSSDPFVMGSQPLDVFLDLVRLGYRGGTLDPRSEWLEAELSAWPGTRTAAQTRAFLQLVFEQRSEEIGYLLERRLRYRSRMMFDSPQSEQQWLLGLTPGGLEELPLRVAREASRFLDHVGPSDPARSWRRSIPVGRPFQRWTRK